MAHRKLWYIALAGLLLLGRPAIAADPLPELGSSAAGVLSPEQERQLAAQVLRQLRAEGVLIDDPEVEGYIQRLGARLASRTDYPGQFRFFVIRSPVVNAFAVPGGLVAVHTGLILNTRNESELAAVLAHEVSHITQHHGARMFEAASRMSVPTMAALVGAILLAMANPDAGQAAIAAVAAGQQQYALNFTRANELEADRIGIRLLAEAGFDPEAMASFFERLQRVNRFNDPRHIPELLRTHPVTVTRIAEARARAARLPHRPQPDSLDYRLMRAKLEVTLAEDPLRALRAFEYRLREAGETPDEAERYGYALALAAAGASGRARVQLERLLAERPQRLAYRLALARLEMADGRPEAGLAHYAAALRDHPDARAVVYGYADALLVAGRPAEARRVLRDYARDRYPDQRYYGLLARTEAALGDAAESHLALAEYYLQAGEIRIAIGHLRQARREPGIDHYQRQRVDARLEELERLRRQMEEDEGQDARAEGRSRG